MHASNFKRSSLRAGMGAWAEQGIGVMNLVLYCILVVVVRRRRASSAPLQGKILLTDRDARVLGRRGRVESWLSDL